VSLGSAESHPSSSAIPSPDPEDPVRPEPTAAQTLTGVARGGSFAAVGSALGAALGLVLTLVITHGLSPTVAGQFFSATAIFLVAQTLLSFGVGAGVVRFIPRLKALGRQADIPALLVTAFVPVAVLALLGSVALWLAAPLLARHVGHDDAGTLVSTYRLIAVLFLPTTLEVAAVEATRGFGSIGKYVLIQQIGIPLLRPILVLFATALDFPLWGVVAMWLVPLVVALVASAVVISRSLQALFGSARAWPARERTLAAIGREYWTFTGARGTSMVMEILLTWLDVVLVASLVSAAQAAVYTAASRFVMAGTLVLQALRLALAADVSAALARRDLGHVSQMYRLATQWVVLSSWPLYLVMAVFSSTVLRIFGDSYGSGGTAMTILCLAMLVNLAAGNVQTVLLMGGKSLWVLADKAACLAVNVGLNLLLIPHLGIRGAAIAWAATIVLDSGLAFIQVRRGMGVGGSLRATALAGGAAAICFGVVPWVLRLTLGEGVAVLAGAIAVGLALYAVPVWRARQYLGLGILLGALRPRATG
jgi:O-antigen/teichoic acid export membrane protein